MKRLLSWIVCGCLVFCLAGCSTAQPDQIGAPSSSSFDSTADTPSNTAISGTSAPMNAILLPTVTETVHADDGTELVSLSFQRAQIILHDEAPEEKIINDFQQRIGPVLENLYQLEEQARLDYSESEYWSGYFIDISYTPTRLDQSVLSLFGNTSSYSGGPHPSITTDSVTYDLHTGDMLCLDEILLPACTPNTLYHLILASLKDQEDALYYDYAEAIGDRFTGELHSVQDWYFSRTGLCFHFAPYDIAPYSSGTVIAELPYSSLAGILKENYFPTELLPSTGSIYAEAFIEDDSERFTYIANVNLCEAGSEVLLYPDAAVTDIRIESGIRYPDSNQFIAVSTVFAASVMNVGDAIHLTGNFGNEDSTLRLVYHSNGQTYSSFITYDTIGDSVLLTNG